MAGVIRLTRIGIRAVCCNRNIDRPDARYHFSRESVMSRILSPRFRLPPDVTVVVSFVPVSIRY